MLLKNIVRICSFFVGGRTSFFFFGSTFFMTFSTAGAFDGVQYWSCFIYLVKQEMHPPVFPLFSLLSATPLPSPTLHILLLPPSTTTPLLPGETTHHYPRPLFHISDETGQFLDIILAFPLLSLPFFEAGWSFTSLPSLRFMTA